MQCNVQLYNTVDFEFHDFDVKPILFLWDKSKKIIKNNMIPYILSTFEFDLNEYDHPGQDTFGVNSI